MTEFEERRLIHLAAKGDGSAFEQLISSHERRMYALALRMCSNAEDAKDCLQDAMLRIYRSLPGFKGESAFSTWVYRVVVNTCLDSFRRQKVRSADSLDLLSENGWNAPDTSPTPEQHAENSELKQQLSKAIDMLPVEMRTAVVLRDVQGFSYESISEMTDANIGTVKSRINRGREKLREILSGIMEQKR